MWLIHNLIVHFAVSLLALAVPSLVVAYYKPDRFWLCLADILLLLGLLAAAMAIISGAFIMPAWLSDHPASWPVIQKHRLFALLSFGGFSIVGLWRWQQLFYRRPLCAPLVLLSLLSLVALTLTGWYGGEIIHLAVSVQKC